jgi:hypothetical protein
LTGRRRALLAAANAVEQRFDRLRFAAKQRLGLLDPFEILPYRGHGTERELFLRGRVLEERGITRSGQHDTPWDNLRNMARRFASDEVPGARVRVAFGDARLETVADEEGFFEVNLELPEPITGPTRWHPVELELLHPLSPGGNRVISTGQVLVPTGADFGVVSDIDDTVVRSSATNVLKMAWIVLLNNAHTRLPFEGVNAFYEALRRGAEGRVHNPIFARSCAPTRISPSSYLATRGRRTRRSTSRSCASIRAAFPPSTSGTSRPPPAMPRCMPLPETRAPSGRRCRSWPTPPPLPNTPPQSVSWSPGRWRAYAAQAPRPPERTFASTPSREM